MSLSRRLCAILAAVAVMLSAATATAADAALNKEGFWTVGRDDADTKGCMASIFAKDGTMLLIQVAPGHVDFVVVGADKPLRRGKKGVLSIGGDSFDFEPAYDDENNLFFFEDVNGRGLAALRLARDVDVRLDGRNLLHVSVERTGLEGALDAVVACSNGKSGWWGPGVGAKPIVDGPAVDKAEKRLVYSKEGLWSLAAGDDPGVCFAQAAVDQHHYLQIIAAFGRLSVAVGSDGEALPRGRKGTVETDAYAFAFTPHYGGDSYMTGEEPFDSQALFALARANWVRMTVDGRGLADANLQGSGFAEVLDSVAACSRGEKGWWGEGAPTAS